MICKTLILQTDSFWPRSGIWQETIFDYIVATENGDFGAVLAKTFIWFVIQMMRIERYASIKTFIFI